MVPSDLRRLNKAQGDSKERTEQEEEGVGSRRGCFGAGDGGSKGSQEGRTVIVVINQDVSHFRWAEARPQEDSFAECHQQISSQVGKKALLNFFITTSNFGLNDQGASREFCIGLPSTDGEDHQVEPRRTGHQQGVLHKHISKLHHRKLKECLVNLKTFNSACLSG